MKGGGGGGGCTRNANTGRQVGMMRETASSPPPSRVHCASSGGCEVWRERGARRTTLVKSSQGVTDCVAAASPVSVIFCNCSSTLFTSISRCASAHTTIRCLTNMGCHHRKHHRHEACQCSRVRRVLRRSVCEMREVNAHRNSYI